MQRVMKRLPVIVVWLLAGASFGCLSFQDGGRYCCVVDAGVDAGIDAGIDAGVDAGTDAGSVGIQCADTPAPGAGCSDGGVCFENFCEVMADLECRRESLCGLFDAGQPVALLGPAPADAGPYGVCRALLVSDCMRRMPFVETGGAFRPYFDVAKAQACRESVRTAPCDRFQDHVAAPAGLAAGFRECDPSALFHKRAGCAVATGAPCVPRLDLCDSGYCATGVSDAGLACATCQPFRPQYAMCTDSSECGPTQSCRYGVCSVRGPHGFNCSDSEACQKSLYCARDAGAAAGLCRTRSAVDAGCIRSGEPSEACVEGAVCLAGKCRIIAPYSLSATAPCNDLGQCAEGLYCGPGAGQEDAGVCTDRLGTGVPCGAAVRIVSSTTAWLQEPYGPRVLFSSAGCLTPQRCVWNGSIDVCQPLVRTGVIGPFGHECEFYANNSQTNACEPFLQRGAACSSNWLIYARRPCVASACLPSGPGYTCQEFAGPSVTVSSPTWCALPYAASLSDGGHRCSAACY